MGQVLLLWCDCETGTLESKKSVLLKIYGSNPVLKNSQIVSVPIPPYNTLLAARKKYFENIKRPSEITESLLMAELYNSIRNYFTQNSWSFFSPEGGRFGVATGWITSWTASWTSGWIRVQLAEALKKSYYSQISLWKTADYYLTRESTERQNNIY